MDQYIGSHKLVTYLHPGPYLELKNEPMKTPSPVTSALLQQNPSLIDHCTFNSSCERYMENSLSSDMSAYKPSVTPTDLYFCLPSATKIEEIQQPSDVTTKLNILPDTTNSPISSAGDCSPNVSSYSSTPYSSPKVKQLVQIQTSSDREHLSVKINQNGNNSASQRDVRQTLIHQTSTESTTNKFDSLPNETTEKMFVVSSSKIAQTSPLLHHLLSSPRKSNEIPFTSPIEHSAEENPNRSPQYRPRYSPFFASKDPPKTSYQSKTGKSTRSKRNNDQIRVQTDSSVLSECSLKNNSQENSNFDEFQTVCSPSKSSNKRTLELSKIKDIERKRQRSKSAPKIEIQQDYCISYPTNISRCVDCQTSNSIDFSMHLTGCRFQHCRRLKHYQDETYEFEGFTRSIDANDDDIHSLCAANSCNQPALNIVDANYVFTRITKLFCLMFLHEQNQRLKHDEKSIIWQRSMAGWREVCDECSTTLFNHHYMCKQCGFMICTECSDQFSQLTAERRKKLKRLCSHENSFLLAEFIPWNLLLNLRNNSVSYLTRLKLDYAMKMYPSSKTENLSSFIKSLKMKRTHDARDIKKVWSLDDCNHDENIEFYCHGRLPVFNEWTSENSKHVFQKVWSSSCPVLVKQVHRNLSKTLWQPLSFKEHMIDHQETPALWDCETLTPITTNQKILSQFWDGFERLDVRLKDEEHGNRSRILKLKDWPTKKDFASVFPLRLHDLMINIPFSDYTRRSYVFDGVTYQGGAMNIVERLPSYLVKPDLGPKLYIAYSQLTSQATKKAGTTNLHIDVSDAVNVLVYVGVGGHGDDGADKDDEIRQVETEILDYNIDEAQLQRLRNGERPGALWHLFRSDDAKKIREYIGRTHRRAPGSDTIHDQSTYLEKEDLEKLRDWSKVESYPILQFLGDAVFVPSGAPHQVKNLHSCIKIAEDFVSPENLDRCLITANEFRSLSKSHTNHADILQAKNILYYSTRDALHSLAESNLSLTTMNSSNVHK